MRPAILRSKPMWLRLFYKKVGCHLICLRRGRAYTYDEASGLANVCLITANMTIVRQRIEIPIPRKRRGSVKNHENGLQRFYEQVYQAIIRHVNFEVVKALIIASPGFVKDQLYSYMFAEAVVRLQH